jgi:hypothetical protein
MPLTRYDAEALRNAIQKLLFYASNPPTSMQERQEQGDAWRTIERLTASGIPVPGEDATVWAFRLREAAWKVFERAPSLNGEYDQARKYIRDCQDTLRVLPTVGNDDSGGADRRDNAEGDAKRDKAKGIGAEYDCGYTVNDAARISGCNSGTISRAVEAGNLKSNGKRGRDRRIDGADLSRWQRDRAKKTKPAESNAAVERLVKKYVCD